jgi:hypothetical protein
MSGKDCCREIERRESLAPAEALLEQVGNWQLLVLLEEGSEQVES